MTQAFLLDLMALAGLQPPSPASLLALWIRLGWGLVVAACVGQLVRAACTARGLPSGTGWAWRVGIAAALATWLAPGPWSAAHWLGLAFFAPSGLLVALSAVVVWRLPGRMARTVARSDIGVAMPPLLAATLAVAGGLLYAAHLTALPIDAYAMGHGQYVPLWVVLPASLVAIGLWWQRQEMAAWAVAAALLAHSLLGLPSPNAWDAVLDPWLWLWAVLACAGHGVRRVATMQDRTR
jgi:hypothetical protein